MKTSFSLNDNTYEMVSMENGRAMFRTPPFALDPSTSATDVVEISHTSSKAGIRRSLLKLTRSIVVDADPTLNRVIVAHCVLSANPTGVGGQPVVASLIFDLASLLTGVYQAVVEPASLAHALLNGVFVPDEFPDIADA